MKWRATVFASILALAAEFAHPQRAYFIEHARKINEKLKQAP